MNVRNLTGSYYHLSVDGTHPLPPLDNVDVSNVDYAADASLRRNVNALADGALAEVTGTPAGFPVRDPGTLPGTVGAAEGDVLTLDAALVPVWTTP